MIHGRYTGLRPLVLAPNNSIKKQKIRKTENESSEFPLGGHLDARAVSSTTSGTDCGPVDAAPRLPRQHDDAPPEAVEQRQAERHEDCLLYTSPSPRDRQKSRMPSSA